MSHLLPRRFAWRSILFVLVIAALVFATRWPLRTAYLYHFDNVNLALALDRFDPVNHQPQPPGYPLFVALSRLVYWIVPDANVAMQLTAMLGSIAAVWLITRLGARLYGETAGLAAGALLLFHQAFWLAAVANQVRVFLAVGSLLVATAAYRAWVEPQAHRWFWAAAAFLAVAGGFRPEQMAFLLPLLLAAGLRHRRPLRHWAVAAVALVLATLVWLLPLIAALEGWQRAYHHMFGYLSARSTDAAAFGVDVQEIKARIKVGTAFTLAGTLAWLWVLPLAVPGLRSGRLPWRWGFLLIWFLPGFLFHLLVHIRHPDHALVTIPVTCLVGGRVLAAVAAWPRWGRAAFAAVTLIACGVTTRYFLDPPGGPVEGDYSSVRQTDRVTREVFDAINSLARRGPVVILSANGGVTWRQLQYYFPQHRLLILHENVTEPAKPEPVWVMEHRRMQSPQPMPEHIPLPTNARLVWEVGPETPIEQIAAAVPLRRENRVPYTELRPGMTFQVGGHRFVTEP